jgi:hypothetical protein
MPSEISYDIFDVGYDRIVVKEDPWYLESANAVPDKSTESVNPNLISGGNLVGNITVTDGYLQSANYVPSVSGWRIDDVLAQFNSIVLTGGTISYQKTSFADAAHAGYYISGSGIYFGGVADATKLKFTIATGVMELIGPSISSAVVTRLASGSDFSVLHWQETMVFSATDYNKVAWSSGTITLSDGKTFSINAGNTGNITALTYIYFDKVASTTYLQATTTAATAIGANKILIAVASPNADTLSKATFQAYGGSGGQLITVDSIAANSASVNEFVSNTAQIKDAIITNAKIASLSVAKLTAGDITGQTIELKSNGTGDCSFAMGAHYGGDTDWTNFRGNDAFVVGVDDSDSDKIRLFLGSLLVGEYLEWNNGLTYAGTMKTVVGDAANLVLDETGYDGGIWYTNSTVPWNLLHGVTVRKGGAYRVVYHAYRGGAGSQPIHFKLKKNGSDFGSTLMINSATPVDQSEDLSGFEDDDLLEVYAYCEDSGDTASIRSIKLYCGNDYFILPQLNFEGQTPVIESDSLDDSLEYRLPTYSGGITSYKKLTWIEVIHNGVKMYVPALNA